MTATIAGTTIAGTTWARFEGLEFTVQWEETTHGTGRIHLWSADSRFTGPEGDEKPGLHLVFDSNPRSCDYHPRYFNRAAKALAAAGATAPPNATTGNAVEVRGRGIRSRIALFLS